MQTSHCRWYSLIIHIPLLCQRHSILESMTAAIINRQSQCQFPLFQHFRRFSGSDQSELLSSSAFAPSPLIPLIETPLYSSVSTHRHGFWSNHNSGLALGNQFNIILHEFVCPDGLDGRWRDDYFGPRGEGKRRRLRVWSLGSEGGGVSVRWTMGCEGCEGCVGGGRTGTRSGWTGLGDVDGCLGFDYRCGGDSGDSESRGVG